MKTALITGISGQDGRYLAEHLVGLGYRVVGLTRRPGASATALGLPGGVELVPGDLLDGRSLAAAVRSCQPDEIYNLAAFTFVPASWSRVDEVAEGTAIAVGRLLEAARELVAATGRPVRFCQASSPEIFGHVRVAPQDESTPLLPRSPYGQAKAQAHLLTAHYRERHGLFACSAILYTHESPRRGEEFATRKISRAVARIKLGRQRELVLGSLDARRDWGYAADFVRAMHLMLQQPRADDYVIGTGELHTIRDFLEVAFGHLGLDCRAYVRTDERLVRAPEPVPLQADPTRARTVLGWRPSIAFAELVRLMVDADLALEQSRPGGAPA